MATSKIRGRLNSWLTIAFAFAIAIAAGRAHAEECGALARHHHVAAGGTFGSVFAKQLLKAPGVPVEHLTDVVGDPAYLAAKVPNITDATNAADRYAAISSMSLRDLIIAPGHAFLSDGAKIGKFVDLLKNQPQTDFSADRLILNVVVNGEGKVQYIDTWNGHNRLVGYIGAGAKTLGDIPANNIVVLINGKTAAGEQWGHYLPIAGVDVGKAPPHSVKGDDQSTLIFGGEHSNYRLGSRTTLGGLSDNMLAVFGPHPTRKQPKVGVFFGTYDPIHEGHVATGRKAKEEFGLDEVVFIPNQNPAHKPGASSFADRLEMAALRLADEPGLNLYTGDTARVIDRAGNLPIMQRIGQIYGTADLYMIEGTDAMQKLIDLNQVNRLNYKYLTFPRSTGDPFKVPGDLSQNILLSKNAESDGLSSSQMRDILRRGETPPESVLDPREVAYIRQHHLYGVGAP